ncbi:MAG: luciferase-like protein [Acidimicrobiales bacterium]|jgi:alkanesulfonate monooxygenase SsuD/methylene tetrahydromethanopterin reductase-like flavin-dependent oxidoreductase (luciferase family)|nr:luciferase-like protein [Acidimicrobiales bacterium]
MTAPLAPGSISLRLYPHLDREAPAIVEELTGQAALAAAHGFDGVMVSEHHAGFYGYLPNPQQMAGWCLEAMATGWAAASPVLLPLRVPTIVAEEAAWLNARFPGRVGLGVAAGGLPADFELLDMPMDQLARRFTAGMERVTALLRGDDGGDGMVGDPAIAACAADPIPITSAVNSNTSVKRAARLGAGIILDSLTAIERCREIISLYKESGGTGAAILIRRAWLGEPPRADLDKQVDVYKSYSSASAMKNWGADEVVSVTDASEEADKLLDALRDTGADALNIRVTVPGVGPEQVRDQITALGDEVLPLVRKAMLRSEGGGTDG